MANRTAAERRHHRNRVIRNRIELAEMFSSEDWQSKPGVLDKNRSRIIWWKRSEPGKGSYIVNGVSPRGFWDDPYWFNTRQALKRELRREVSEALHDR